MEVVKMEDRLFRDTMGKFATGVTVLTTEKDEVPHGMTANGFMSVSLHPKLVVISIGHQAKFLEKVQKSGKFAVNILSEEQENYSRHFAGRPGEEPIVFNTLAGLPVLDGVVAQIACEVVGSYIEGDHTLFIGQVLEVAITDKDPLLFFVGQYRRLGQLEFV